MTKFDQEDDDDDLPLAVLKPEVPAPFGITVAHVQHSEYGGDSVDHGADEKDMKTTANQSKSIIEDDNLM